MIEPTRRSFLKRASVAAMAAGISGCVSSKTKPDAKNLPGLKITVQPSGDPLMARTAAILRDRIRQRIGTGSAKAHVMLAVDASLPAEAFRIETQRTAVRISGGTPRGVLYGAGKFLRTSGYGKRFEPSAWRGVSTPHGSLRGMYFATHFHNWYHRLPDAEITAYVEDLALWGANAFMVIFPMINLKDWNDPDAEPAMEMVRAYAKAVKALGLQFVTSVNNTMFTGAPDDIRAARLPDPTHRRGNSGHPICPSNPKGHAYLMENAREFFERLRGVGVDLLIYWPYDEGGCSCASCAPWGSNGYVKLSRDFTELGRQYFPDVKTILSTWMFDTPPEGEWQGLTDTLAKGNGWLNYILADAHEDFPRYPLDNGVPGKLPLLNFPEISMWGNGPWGGVGANPLPSRFQRLWDQVKHAVDGGFPYSEGIYEDMNKAVELQFYWNPDQTARDTLKEYAAYEFGPGVGDDTLQLVDLLEQAASQSYRKQPVDRDGVQQAFQLAETVHARIPAWGRANWRWEIVHLRALLDRERFIKGNLKSPEAEAALLRLIEIYHCQLETDDPYHHRVRPASSKAVSRQGQL